MIVFITKNQAVENILETNFKIFKMAAKCWPNAHNFSIFEPILMILVSKFMVHRVLSDKIYLLLGLLSPLIRVVCAVYAHPFCL